MYSKLKILQWYTSPINVDNCLHTKLNKNKGHRLIPSPSQIDLLFETDGLAPFVLMRTNSQPVNHIRHVEASLCDFL